VRVAVIGDGLLGHSLFDELQTRSGLGVIGIFGHSDSPGIEITDLDSVKRALDGYDVAINTAAFHNVAECERDKERAIAVNTDGARNVASVLPTLTISTDYVFNDGGPHDEVLPGERPRSVYGQTKLGGELATLERGGIVVRVSGLYGRYDSKKGRAFADRIADDEYHPIKLPSDQVFSPTWAPDAAKRIVDLALGLPASLDFTSDATVMEPVGGIYHAANAGSVSWAAFAEEILNLVRHRRHVTAYAAHDPIRPKNSALLSTRLPPLPHWRLALNEWAVWREERIFANRVSPLREGA
jgi:dTDP-4-dehydrorhamnose reductase